MPRSFLVKKTTEVEHGDRSDSPSLDVTADEIDVVGDDIEEGEEGGFAASAIHSDCDCASAHESDQQDERTAPGHADVRLVTSQQLSPPGAIAMVVAGSSQRSCDVVDSVTSSQQSKTSPSIAPQLFSPSSLYRGANSKSLSLSPPQNIMEHRGISKSLSPPSMGMEQSQTDVNAESLKYAAYRRYSDPKFWQNTLPSITHHYVSPFNFHRLPHAILASNSHQQNSQHSPPFQSCLPLAPPGPALPSYAMTTQTMFRPSSFDASRMSLSALAQYDHRGEGKIPYAFVQPTSPPNHHMFSPMRSPPVDLNRAFRSPEHHDIAMRESPDRRGSDDFMKMNPTSQAIAIDNNNSASMPNKTLPWLHELPYALPKDLEPASERISRRPHDPPRYQCDACKKSYATFSGLSKHKQFHCESHVKKEFSCKYCEKTYNSLGALKMHIRTHTLPCKCQICGKAFSRPWLLQGHLRTHTGEKPFVCPQCGRAFADRSNLRAHLQTHSDVKKYSCTDCSKTFSRMSLLVKHKEGSCPGIRNTSLQTMISAAV